MLGGTSSGTKISKCSNTGNITASCGYTIYMGGIASTLSSSSYSAVIENCYNKGDLYATITTTAEKNIEIGGIVGQNSGSINKCYNTGDITGIHTKDETYLGGISGECYSGSIYDCYNVGDIYSKDKDAYAGGITGCRGSVNRCYSYGNIYAEGTRYIYAGGIAGTSASVYNSYNYGDIRSVGSDDASDYYAGGILGGSSNSVSNTYNVGSVVALGSKAQVGPVVGQNRGVTNSFYIQGLKVEGASRNTQGTVASDSRMKSTEIVNTLGTSYWKYKEGSYPELKETYIETAKPTTELVVFNKEKQFKITTEVKNNIGGTISGSNEDPYELVLYGDNNIKPIVITPNSNYMVIDISINDKPIIYNVNDDGTVILPENYFTDVQEDKKIVVTFGRSDSIVTISKVDGETGEKLNDAEFEIGKFYEDRSMYYGYGNYYVNGVSNPYNFSRYYNNVYTNVYTSTNVGQGKSGCTAYSYIPIELEDEGDYKIVVNAEIFSELSSDIGWVTAQRTNTPNTSYTGRFVNISGEKNASDYESEVFTFDGQENPYITVVIAYTKDGNNTNDNEKDTFNINSVKLVEVNTGEEIDVTNRIEIYNNSTYYFTKYDNQYVATNGRYYQSTLYANTSANSYMSGLPSYGKYFLEYDITIIGDDPENYGYATVSTGNTTMDETGSNVYCFMKESGPITNKVFRTGVLDYYSGGPYYYINLGYKKVNSPAGDDSRMIINKIVLYTLYEGDTTIINKGEKRLSLEEGKYSIKEIKAPNGYALSNDIKEFEVISGQNTNITFENYKKSKLVVHHYLKDENGKYTTNKVSNDEVYYGIINEKYYTKPHIDLENLIIEKDPNGNIVIPENANGTYVNGDIEVNYYYEAKPVELTIHHYLSGTENSLVDNKTIESEAVVIYNDENNYTVEANGSYTLNDNEDYRALLEKYDLVRIDNSISGETEIDDTINYSNNAEITYYYSLKKFNVITTVEEHEEIDKYGETISVKGGNISGEEEDIYETVKYDEDSTKEIEAVPEDGYEIRTITINGEETDVESDENGNVKLNRFIAMRENKNVVVEFQKLQGRVVIHHYLENTEEKVPSNDGGVVDDEIRQGDVGAIYATKASDNVNPMYEFVRTTGETYGEIGEEEKVVIYYYKLRDPIIKSSIQKEAITNSTIDVVEDNTTITYPLITKENEQITYKLKYNTSIDDYKGKAILKIEDVLPSYINLAKSDIQDGTYDEERHTITWEEEVELDTFTNGKYETEIEKEITVSYILEKFNIDLENIVKGSVITYCPENNSVTDGSESRNKELLIDTVQDEAVVKQEYKVRLQVKKIWNDNDNQKQHRPEDITVTIKANNNLYKELVLNEDNGWQYEESDLPKYDESGIEIDYTVEEKETNENDLKYYENSDIKKIKIQDRYETTNLFEIINGLNINTSLVKEGPEKITKSTEAVNYEIHLNSIMTNYRGTGRVKIIDTLPYKIDAENSILDGGIYDEETNTITWEEDVTYLYIGEESDEDSEDNTVDNNEGSETQNSNENTITNEISNEITNEVTNSVTNEISDTITNETVNEVNNETTGENNDSNNTSNITNSNLVPVGASIENNVGYKLEISKYITIVYKDIVFSDGTIENTVRAEIEIDGLELIDTAEDDSDTSIEIPGKVIVKYIDEATGKELTKKITKEGLVGKQYTTEEKEFADYVLIGTPINSDGEYKEEITEVIYYYKTTKSPEPNPTPTPSPTPTPAPEPQPDNTNKETKKEEKRSVVKRIVNPKTGDMVPVVAYTTIFVVLAVNIMLVRYNRRELARVTRTSRISRIIQSDRANENIKTQKKKAWVKSDKARRAK